MVTFVAERCGSVYYVEWLVSSPDQDYVDFNCIFPYMYWQGCSGNRSE